MGACAGDGYSERGIIPRALEIAFAELSRRGLTRAVSVSFLEIYNENVYDLLDP